MPYFVSVIIPNYNHAPFLDERLSSVLKQTYQNFEIIILDDKSNDKSKEVIEKYRKNPKVSQIVYNDNNSGSPFIQWEKGMSLSKGELIWIAESDDSCEPNLLESLVDLHKKNDNVAFAFCRFTNIDINGNKKTEENKTFFNKSCYPGKEFLHNYLIWRNVILNASSVLFNKKTAYEVNKQYMNFKGAGDWLFWIEMAEKGNVCVDNRPLNYYRTHGDNTTRQLCKSGIEDNEIHKIYKYLKDKGHLSVINDIRIRKMYISKIKYFNNFYENEEIREYLLDIWKPNYIDSFFAFLSYRLHTLR